MDKKIIISETVAKLLELIESIPVDENGTGQCADILSHALVECLSYDGCAEVGMAIADHIGWEMVAP